MDVHGQIREDLKAYVDRELPLWRALSVRRHLAGCAACRKEIEEMANIAERVKPAEPDKIEAELRGRILSAAPAGLADAPKRPVHRANALAWAACVGLFALIGVTSVRFLGGTSASKLNSVAATRAMESGGYKAAPIMDAAQAEAQVRQVQAIPNLSQQAKNTAIGMIRGHEPGGGVQLHQAGGNTNIPPISTPGDLRRVHRTASMQVRTDDPEAASAKVIDMVKGAGGYVGDSDLSTDNGGKSLHMTLKVPVQQLDTILAAIAGLGEVQAKHLQGEDITKAVSDADQRDSELEQEMQNAAVRIARMKKMDWRTQEWMRDLKIQLAQARADLKMQRSLAELGDVDLTITSKPTVQTGFWAGFGSGGKDAMESFTQTLGMVASWLVWLLVYSPIWLPILLLGRWSYGVYNRRIEAEGRS